ncbi:hypothetical protein CoNPh17_CDS0015 [Staphylococcus phage S-CoN_Ph17]|nr:hypothetical protein CoNPh17_CDS0015 [Staphylococcus phage S-CoN_Ph17]
MVYLTFSSIFNKSSISVIFAIIISISFYNVL